MGQAPCRALRIQWQMDMSDLVRFGVLGADRHRIITFTNNQAIANREKCYEGKVWGVMKPRGDLIFFWSIKESLSGSHREAET